LPLQRINGQYTEHMRAKITLPRLNIAFHSERRGSEVISLLALVALSRNQGFAFEVIAGTLAMGRDPRAAESQIQNR
jgi:hypothetical protein